MSTILFNAMTQNFLWSTTAKHQFVNDRCVVWIFVAVDHLTDDHEHACDAILSFLQHPDGPHYPKLMGDLLEQVAVKCGPIVETKRACGDQDALFSIYSLLTGS